MPRWVTILLSAGLLPVGLVTPHRAQAGIAEFVAGCMANVADLRALPATLERQGYVEVDPAQGPPGPSLAMGAAGRRLWTIRHPGNGQVDIFTGYVPPGPDVPFEICWHISRPGDTATEAISALQSRYPAVEGTTETGTEMVYGGFERWRTKVGPVAVTLGVTWGMRGRPAEGSSLLYVVLASSPA